MVNKKRDRNGYKRELGRYKLRRAHLLTIEKILWTYADAVEMQHAKVGSLPKGRKHMPRQVIDRCVSIGRYRPFHFSFGWNEYSIHYAGVDWIHNEDSVKFLSKPGYPKKTCYFELAAWPGIRVTLTPLSTIIYAQTQYATGIELLIMKKAVSALEDYLLALPKALINTSQFK